METNIAARDSHGENHRNPCSLMDNPPQIPKGGYRGRFHDQPQPRTIDSNWDQGGWHNRGNNHQSQSSEQYPWRHQQPQNGHAEQLHQPLCWDPPSYRHQRTFYAAYEQWQPTYHPPEELHKHQPQQSSNFIDPGKQRGLPNIPSLKVRSPCPTQLAAVSDYNEKLRIYRLEQAALLARLNCVFEGNIDDENLVENVPNNAVHNGGANLDVLNDESMEEIVKTDNMPLQVLVGTYDEKIVDLSVPTPKELEMKDVIATLLEKETKAEALRSSSEPKEKDFSVLTEKPSKRESRVNQSKRESLVDDIKAGFDMKKKDSQEEMEEKRRLFEDELKLKVEELGKTRDAHSGSQALACVYVDLIVTDITIMNPRLPSLDADARLIPLRNNKPCLSIHGCVARLFILALNCHDNNVAGVSAISYIQQGFALAILGGIDERICSTLRCVIDPGGDASPKLLLSTLVIASCLSP